MFRDITLTVIFGLSLLVLVAAAALAVFGLTGGSGNLILHFTAGRGVDLLGNRAEVLVALGVIFTAGVVNIVLAREIYYRERFLSYLLAFATLVIAIFSLIATGVVISVN